MFDYEKVCPQCGIENELHAIYCVLCSALLDKEEYEREESRKIADTLDQHVGIREKLVKLLSKNPS